MNPLPPLDPRRIRTALLETLPEATSHYSGAPNARFLYVPEGHQQALSTDRPLVLGIRGAGKSLWWSALQKPALLRLVERTLPKLQLARVAKVSPGFGQEPQPNEYPDRNVLEQLLGGGYLPSEIWRTVVAIQTWGSEHPSLARPALWRDRVDWVTRHPEEVALAFGRYEESLSGQQRRHLVLFDALDRSAHSWPDLDRLLRGLLELLLEFRTYRSIRLKAFVRPDMLQSPTVLAFPDASKLKQDAVELHWTVQDLYGLLFHHLGNSAESGDYFRGETQHYADRWTEEDGAWVSPRSLREDPAAQRQLFHSIASKWMGNDQRRGFPYTWLITHLQDALRQVSPRSFLNAIRKAASEHRVPPGWGFALYYEDIKKGVQEASRIRVAEVEEDFPWVKLVMRPLAGLSIPCSFAEIQDRWNRARVSEDLDELFGTLGVGGSREPETRLPPRSQARGLEGLRENLIELGLFNVTLDGRVNMPDVYRVGFGLGRKGGVKPIR